MIRVLAALLCLTIAAPLTLGNCHRRKVVVPVVFVPVLPYVPTYTGSYIPAPEQPKPLEPAPATALILLHNKCSACHTEDRAESRGGGQIILNTDGSVAPLSLAERRRLVEVVEKSEMPPRGNSQLSESEKRILKSEFGKK